jgi:serine/threonine protein kinase
MGEVFRARDTKLNRDVAIKVLLPAVGNDPDRLARFSREAQVLASLNHSNIAAIYGIEESNGVTALVMELVDGEDLSRRIARGPIPIDEALPIARQIAEALEAAHDVGIIHRDLKPANIKLRADGAVKVLDFGLAKAIPQAPGPKSQAHDNLANSPTLSLHATEAGIILGTAAYMSPEQARGKFVDRRTDIWAFGAVLFEMLTGQRAFRGDAATDTIVAVISQEPDWSGLPSKVPSQIRTLMRRALEKDPRQRLDSAAAVRLEIDDARRAPVATAAAATSAGRLLPWGVAALVAIALAALVLIQRPPPAQSGSLVRFGLPAPFGFTRPSGYSFALSPDGQVVAFAAVGNGGVTHIFTRRLNQAEARIVPGTQNASQPFWSPDSRSLGFAKDDSLYRTEADGGTPQRLCDVPGGTPSSSFSMFATWSTSGVIVFAARGGGLLKVLDVGGTPVPITTLDAGAKELQHASPSFLPDGKRLLFLALDTASTRGVIWAVSIDNPARTRVTESSGGAQYVDGWLLTTTAPPRGLVAQRFDEERLSLSGEPLPIRDRLPVASSTGPAGFAAATGGTLIVDRPPPVIFQLVWVDARGIVHKNVGPAAPMASFALAPDGARVVANVTNPDSGTYDLFLLDSEQRAGTRLTFEGTARMPIWSHDGRQIYFRIAGASGAQLRSIVIGGAKPVPIENPGGLVDFHDATHDGRYLVLVSLPPRRELWLQRVGAADERRPLVQNQFAATQGRVSPDGRWLSYTLALPSGNEVFVQPFDRPGERMQVSRSGGFGAIWRGDSRELYFESADGLMAAMITDRGGAIDAGLPRKLFTVRTQGYVSNQPHNIAATADGRQFLVNTVVGDSDNAPLEVTLNWTAGLKQ